MFSNITAQQYQQTFDRALVLLKSYSTPVFFDAHEVAHQAAEKFLQNPSEDLQNIISDIFSCIAAWADIQHKIENPKEDVEVADEFSRAEATLDLARLYQQVAAHLSEDERRLYLKVWSSGDLTDDEALLIEDLGSKVRKVLDAQTSTEKFFYKTGRDGKKGQVTFWQGFYQKRLSAAAKAHPPRNRGSSQRLCH